MPIKGLTDNDGRNFGSGLPLIARMYKGDERPADGKRPGADLTYFRVEFEPQFEHLRELWTEMYGAEPTEFSGVFLAGATVDEAFSTWLEEWTATTLLHRCDGEHQVQWFDTRINAYSRAKVMCAKDSTGGCKCQRIGRLNLIMPDFVEAAGVLGYIAVATHSINDIITIHRYLSDIERMYGRLTGVPFVFGRAQKDVSTPKENGGRRKVKKSLLYLHVTPEFTQEHLLPTIAAPRAPMIAAPNDAPQLPAGAMEPEVIEDAEYTDVEPAPLPKIVQRERRISGPAVGEKPAPAAAAPEPAPAPATNGKRAEWTPEYEQGWRNFLKWADETFGYDGDAVLLALNDVMPPVVTKKDWRGTSTQAKGAIIAAANGWDAERVGTWCDKANANDELRARAHDMIAARALLLTPEVR